MRRKGRNPSLHRRAAKAIEKARALLEQSRELAAANKELHTRIARADRELHRHMSHFFV